MQADTDPNQEIVLRNLSYLKGRHFTIEYYQRGYKWGRREVLQLLADIEGHDPSRGIYCLQPLILSGNSTGSFEIVDGQQRCTTIFLILHLLQPKAPYYHIAYRTRDSSERFLREHLHLLDGEDIASIGSLEDINDNAATDKLWEGFVAQHGQDFDNVDIYHFFTVYLTTRSWFALRGKPIKPFLSKLLNKVSFIWYQVPPGDSLLDASERFLNFNQGKIELTSSELIKALFILDIKRSAELTEIKDMRVSELSLEWDLIERQLHDDDFWFFVCDRHKIYNKGTRIDLLFDLLRPQRSGKHDELFAYRCYEQQFNQKMIIDWKEVKNVFNRLTDWYNDKELYHYVGYLIVTGIRTLKDIYHLSHVRKDDFRHSLKGMIKKKFAQTTRDEPPVAKYALENVNFDQDRVAVGHVLLLFNVVYYLKSQTPHRFPYQMYLKHEWTIEHINPQRPREMTQVSQYLDMAREFFENADTEFTREVISFLRELGDQPISSLEKEQTTALDNYFQQISRDFNLHDLGNLTLLDRNTNSAVGNLHFMDKRKKILRFDSEGRYFQDGKPVPVFIPIGTKNVFSKSYTLDQDALQQRYWTVADQQHYLAAIGEQLIDFLPPSTT